MLDAREIRRGIYEQLTGTRAVSDLVAARVYHAIAPESADYPLIIFHRQSGVPRDAFGAPRALDRQMWLVKCVDEQTTSSTAEAAQATIVSAMESGVTVTGAIVHDVRYTSPVDYVEMVNGRQYRHHGALFRLVLSET